MFQIRRMCFFKSVNNSQTYDKSLALLCHQELAEQMHFFKFFMFHTVVQWGFKWWREVSHTFCRQFIAVSNSERIFKIG